MDRAERLLGIEAALAEAGIEGVRPEDVADKDYGALCVLWLTYMREAGDMHRVEMPKGWNELLGTTDGGKKLLSEVGKDFYERHASEYLEGLND